MPKRIFKLKAFGRWAAKNALSDGDLAAAAVEVDNGQYEASLGQGVYKKRIALAGGGKSGGGRILLTLKNNLAIILMTGRIKSDPGTDFHPMVTEMHKEMSKIYGRMPEEELNKLVASGELEEI